MKFIVSVRPYSIDESKIVAIFFNTDYRNKINLLTCNLNKYLFNQRLFCKTQLQTD